MTRRTLVTGGSSGIGAAIVRRLAADGHEVVFTFNSSAEGAAELCAIDPDSVSSVCLDLSVPDSLPELRESIAHRQHAFDGFIHCAGQTYDKLSMSGDRSAILALMQTNLLSMIEIVGMLLPAMSRARFGRILCLGSVTAESGNRGNAFYASSKAGLVGYLRSSVAEIGSRGITFNCIAPGFIETPMLDRYSGLDDAVRKRVPAQRVGKPHEVAALASFLMSEEAGYINGATIAIDGGLSSTLGWSAT